MICNQVSLLILPYLKVSRTFIQRDQLVLFPTGTGTGTVHFYGFYWSKTMFWSYRYMLLFVGNVCFSSYQVSLLLYSLLSLGLCSLFTYLFAVIGSGAEEEALLGHHTVYRRCHPNCRYCSLSEAVVMMHVTVLSMSCRLLWSRSWLTAWSMLPMLTSTWVVWQHTQPAVSW